MVKLLQLILTATHEYALIMFIIRDLQSNPTGSSPGFAGEAVAV